MEILVKGNKKQSLIFGCRDCGCIFIANADEYTYNSRLERNYCECPECDTKCTGTEIDCYFCKYIYTGQCDSKYDSVYDKEICDSFEVNKSKLWSWLGYQNEEE